MGLKTSDFHYELPEELIAQDPLSDRSSSRLMVMDRDTGAVTHRYFRDLPGYLKRGDVLVLNDTKVIPARLMGRREGTGGAVEVLLLRRLENETDTWETLVNPGKKCRPGQKLEFGDGRLRAEVLDILEEGIRKIRFRYDGIFEEVLDSLGEMPLPPYIRHKLKDRDRYQTVYARYDGSAAAPTAGLHFTKELLSGIGEKGVDIVYVTLHVGLGTFRPVKEEDILDHHMHTEHFVVSADAARRINRARENGGRVVCVGTTSVRTLESASDEEGRVRPCSGDTDIFIYPGYRFKAVDALITNFHLPESTLIMLVSAFAGRENTLAAYNTAVRERYRFFSFGDAMMIQ
ncbi:MAG: tRNA preQ1(34) S-adenosylmethionine ribosyltransferase-isomerase QueA [Lachnospiraceae bacterium]|nr:tRNA preQ1(34) S-adenosylmethionine ribosyltransferase-isomerase QueA [Lachnospiraceae bacterium]